MLTRSSGHGVRRSAPAAIAVLAVVLLSSSCGSSVKDAAAPKPVPAGLVDICGVFEKVNTAAAATSNGTEGLEVLRSFAAEVDAALSSPPDAVSDDGKVVLVAVRSALAQGKLGPLTTNEVATAGGRLAQACNITPAAAAK